MAKTFSFIWEIGKIAVVAFVLVAGLRLFVFQPFLVRGASMEPSFHNWDYLIVDEISYRFGEPERGEVIVFKFPNDPSQRYIKRIIGLPGETIELEETVIRVSREGERFVLDEADYVASGGTFAPLRMQLGQNEYFVMGDNRSASSDSRRWGPLSKDNIIGKVFVRVFPISAFAKVDAPEYSY